jgi:hypothetical protein
MSTVLPDLLDNRYRDDLLNDLQQKKFGYYGYNKPLSQSKASTVYFTKETDKDFKQLGNYKKMDFDRVYNIVITFKPLDNLFSSDRKLYILNSNIPNVIDYLNNKGEDIRFHLKNDNDTYTEVKLYTGLEKDDILKDERNKRRIKEREEEEYYQRQINDGKFNRIDEGGARNKSKKQLKKSKKVKKSKKTKKRTRKQRRKQRSKRIFSIK